MSETNGKLARAIQLTQPGRVFAPDEIRLVIAAADALEAGSGPTTRDEERVCRVASRLRIYGSSNPTPAPIPADLLQRVAADAAEVQAKDMVSGRLLEDVVAARAKAMRAKTSDELARLTDAARDVERAWGDARFERDRAQAKLCDAQRAVAEFQRQQLANT